MKSNEYKITEDVLIKTVDKHGEEYAFYVYAGHVITTDYGKEIGDGIDHRLISITGKLPKDREDRNAAMEDKFIYEQY